MRSVRIPVAIGAVVVTIAAAWVALLSPVHPDEAVFLTIAKGIREGLLPYRDLFDHKTPSIYYTLSPLSGLPISYLRLIGTGLLILTGYSTYLLAKQVKASYALVAGILTICLGYIYQGTFLLTEMFMMPFILGAIYLSSTKKLPSYEAVGLFFGVAFLYRQYALIFLAAYVIWLWQETRSIKAIVRLNLGACIPISTALLLAHQAGILQDSLIAIISFNLTYATKIQYSIQDYVYVALPILPLVIAATWASKFRHASPTQRLVTYMALANLPQLLIRPYHHYWLQTIPWLAIIASTLPKHYLRALGIYAVVASLFQASFYYTQRHELPIQQDHAHSTPCQDTLTATDYALGPCPPPKYFYTPS